MPIQKHFETVRIRIRLFKFYDCEFGSGLYKFVYKLYTKKYIAQKPRKFWNFL
jgi:hypothetical protein